MARHSNHEYNLLSSSQQTQIEIEELIKYVMEKTSGTHKEKLKLINNEIQSISSRSFDNTYLPTISEEEFNNFVNEYNNITTLGKVRRAAEYMMASIVKALPKTIGLAIKSVGKLIDTIGTGTKITGRNLPIGDLGASISHKFLKSSKSPASPIHRLRDRDAEELPYAERMRGKSLVPKNSLGAISGIGKIVSEVGSHIEGFGMAINHSTDKTTISSPAQRLAKKVTSKRNK